MLKTIDNFLNKITMYRLTLYCLLIVWSFGFLLSLFSILPYKPVDLIITFALIFICCIAVNALFAYAFKVPSNIDSVYITSIILALIIYPSNPFNNLDFIFLSSALAIASKYIIVVRKKHLFNPAALGVALSAFILNKYAVWWIGTLYMAPIVLATGLLIVKKLQRFDLVFSFFITLFVLIMVRLLIYGQGSVLIIRQLIIDSPLMFMAFVMLTEPATTPPRRKLRIIYGSLVGVLFTPFINIFGFYFTPEIALLTGNIFSYLISPKDRFILKLKEKKLIANNVYNFIFSKDRKMKFEPGQYLEWTLGHKKQDNRGMRRYFTIASSPTEKDVIIGVKFYDKPSSYKKALNSLTGGGTIIASQLAGDFTLPKDKQKKLVFLAGGIGVTPFRSMIKYLLDKNEKRDIVMYYANKSFTDIAYKEIFSKASTDLGIKIIHVIDDTNGIPNGFFFEKGPINMEMIKRGVPDYKKRVFYISGPKAMVDSFKKELKALGIDKLKIKTDFFPGFA